MIIDNIISFCDPLEHLLSLINTDNKTFLVLYNGVVTYNFNKINDSTLKTIYGRNLFKKINIELGWPKFENNIEEYNKNKLQLIEVIEKYIKYNFYAGFKDYLIKIEKLYENIK